MYKLSVPVSIQTMNEKSLPVFTEEFKKAGVERVFLCGLLHFFKKECYIYNEPEKMEYLINYFKEQGFEVGVWEGSFGHGGALNHDKESEYVGSFTRILGVDGKEEQEAFCPLDDKFRQCYYNNVKKLAAMHPDIIMFDDDFRLNTRYYNMGCCCPKHLKMFSESVGEEIPKEKLEEVVFSGGENRYRSAWLKVMGESVENFARLMRSAVDEVDETIRLGCCICHDTWDFSGTDGIKLAKAFAGKTKPFLRTIGAPYHSMKVQNAIEYTRMQANWCKGEDIELFTEGDVYPRPRYIVPSRPLEIFDMALLATGETDGILKYMFDYSRDVEYEMGYNERHIKNKPLRDGIKTIFEGKKSVGVRVFEAMHKIEKYEFPKKYESGISHFAENTIYSTAAKLLSENAVPSAYEDSGYPVIVFGENARYITENELENGAVIDAAAAEILQSKGIDTGVLKCEKAECISELFCEENDEITCLDGIATIKAECNKGVIVKSEFMPQKTPASYLYENEKGIRFYVLMIDSSRSNRENYNYFNSYHRQKHLAEAIKWLCEKPLPAFCGKNPFLYILASKNNENKAMSVALFNINIDEIIKPEIILDKEYSDIRFIGCDGKLEGSKVILSGYIEPYGIAAFEVCE